MPLQDQCPKQHQHHSGFNSFMKNNSTFKPFFLSKFENLSCRYFVKSQRYMNSNAISKWVLTVVTPLYQSYFRQCCRLVQYSCLVSIYIPRVHYNYNYEFRISINRSLLKLRASSHGPLKEQSADSYLSNIYIKNK